MAVWKHLTLQNAGLTVVALFIYFVVKQYLRDRRLQKFGALSPRLNTRWSLGKHSNAWKSIQNTKINYRIGATFLLKGIRMAQQHKVMDFWLQLVQQTGALDLGHYTFEFVILGSRYMFSSDPANIKALLTTQFTDFGKGEKFHEEWHDFLGDSIFVTDGQLWQGSRQLIRPMFMRERVADLDLVEEHVVKLCQLMGTGDGRMVYADKLFSRFSLDASTHFLFGHSAGSLDDEEARFGVAFDEVQRVQAMSMRAGPLKHLMSWKSFYAGLRTMDEFINPWIEETLGLSPEELESKLAKSDTFIHALARYTRDRKMIRDQLVSLLLAGRDTTAATLSWLFMELARNPRVLEKLRAEIQTTLGSDDTKPTYENVKDMKYLTSVINETLRLYPAVPFNLRCALKDTTLPMGGGPDGKSPVAIAKDTFIGYSTLVMQRRRDLYPPISDKFPYDPLQWVPERWETWTPKAWQFIPFNGGPRICIGQQFAMVEMGYTIIRILQQFDTIKDYGNDVIMKTDILLTPANGVKIGFVKKT